jgi:hypothetical protein
MAIFPGNRHGVVSDRTHVGQSGLLERQSIGRRQDARHATFTPADRTRALPAEEFEPVGAVVLIQPRYVNTSPLGEWRDDVGHALIVGQGDHQSTSLRIGCWRELEDSAKWLIEWLRRGNPNDLIFAVSKVQV